MEAYLLPCIIGVRKGGFRGQNPPLKNGVQSYIQYMFWFLLFTALFKLNYCLRINFCYRLNCFKVSLCTVHCHCEEDFQTSKILKVKHGNGNKLDGNNSFNSQFFNAPKLQNILRKSINTISSTTKA